jgi:hypothetical protein
MQLGLSALTCATKAVTLVGGLGADLAGTAYGGYKWLKGIL